MQLMGNSKAKAIYESSLSDNYRRSQTDSAMEQFIRCNFFRFKIFLDFGFNYFTFLKKLHSKIWATKMDTKGLETKCGCSNARCKQRKKFENLIHENLITKKNAKF